MIELEHAEFLTLKISTAGKEPDFSSARLLADDLAASNLRGPMLIAWYDGRKNEEHPYVPECQHKPGWLAYAEGHGGCIRVDVDEGQYSFIYADVDVPEA